MALVLHDVYASYIILDMFADSHSDWGGDVPKINMVQVGPHVVIQEAFQKLCYLTVDNILKALKGVRTGNCQACLLI